MHGKQETKEGQKIKMGFDIKFTDNSGLVLSALESAVENSLEEIGLRGEGYAVQNAPVGTPESTQIKHYKGGSLKNSITHKVVGNTVHIGTNITSVVKHYDTEGNRLADTKEPYAIYVELGTGKYATNKDGRKSPWMWIDHWGERHWTEGIQPTHFLRDSIANHQKEYINAIKNNLKGK